MAREVTEQGEKVLSAIESKLGREPSREAMEAVHKLLKSRGFPELSEGNTTRYVFALPDEFVTGGGVVKLPRKEADFFGDSLVHLGVDQNIRSIYTAEYLSEDGLAPPTIGYSSKGSWVVFPIVHDLSEQYEEEFKQKADRIREREDVNCVTGGETSGTPDIDIRENWGVYQGEVVLRDVGSVAVREVDAPVLNLVADPHWEL
ncbi:hypothetical protein [Halomontanus rarus]|uniref:hypothetical protein n=1 Tax=Halomontanus rarus TaxID=3034020 RepID=UPI001A995FA0